MLDYDVFFFVFVEKVVEFKEFIDLDNKFGIVGVVVLDQFGNFVVVILIGGIINKQFGCVGDLFIIGVGCYVNNVIVVVLVIGIGEVFMCIVVCYDIGVCMVYVGQLLEEVSCVVVFEILFKVGGCGGVIVIDCYGNLVLFFNIEGMYCVWGCGELVLVIVIYVVLV